MHDSYSLDHAKHTTAKHYQNQHVRKTKISNKAYFCLFKMSADKNVIHTHTLFVTQTKHAYVAQELSLGSIL